MMEIQLKPYWKIGFLGEQENNNNKKNEEINNIDKNHEEIIQCVI